MLEIVRNWILNQGVDLSTADLLSRGLIVVSIIILSLVAYILAKHFILKGLTAIMNRTATEWDDIFLRKKVFNRLAYLAPAIVIYSFIAMPLEGYEMGISLVKGIASIYMIGMAILAIDAFLNASLDIYNTHEISNKIPTMNIIYIAVLIIVNIIPCNFIWIYPSNFF